MPPRAHFSSSHLGSMPSLNRWKSVPWISLEGVTMLLYRLAAREAAGQALTAPRVGRAGRRAAGAGRGCAPPEVLHRAERVHGAQRLAVAGRLLPAVRVVKPERPEHRRRQRECQESRRYGVTVRCDSSRKRRRRAEGKWATQAAATAARERRLSERHRRRGSHSALIQASRLAAPQCAPRVLQEVLLAAVQGGDLGRGISFSRHTTERHKRCSVAACRTSNTRTRTAGGRKRVVTL